MSTARDIMHQGAECIGENETVGVAAQKMRDLHVGALPICGEDDRLKGIITDRDIIVRCVAEGRDPQTMTARDLAQGKPVTVGVDADATEVLDVMIQHKVRRVPVLQGNHIVGMITEADLATHLDEHQVRQFASSLYSAPPTN